MGFIMHYFPKNYTYKFAISVSCLVLYIYIFLNLSLSCIHSSIYNYYCANFWSKILNNFIVKFFLNHYSSFQIIKGNPLDK